MTQLTAPPVSLLDMYKGEAVLPLYTTEVTVTGGEAKHARSSGRAVSDDGALDLALRLPKALGGPGGASNPEQLFAAGYGACFHGALTLVAMKRKVHLPSDLSIKVAVTFGRDPSDGLFLLEADIQVALPGVSPANAASLIEETEKICPYAKMTRQGIAAKVRIV